MKLTRIIQIHKIYIVRKHVILSVFIFRVQDPQKIMDTQCAMPRNGWKIIFS